MTSQEALNMTQEQKDLLLKDLCGRVPYNPKFTFGNNVYTLDGIFECVNDEWFWVYCLHAKGIEPIEIELCKPYLFPMSSMTDEQKKEISKRYNLHTSYGLCIEITNHSEGYWDDDNSCHLQDYLWLVDWLNKHHFDYRGLIEKGLALDATNLGIYE